MSNENGHNILPESPAKRTLKYSLRGSFDCECSRSADALMMHVLCEQRSSPVTPPVFPAWHSADAAPAGVGRSCQSAWAWSNGGGGHHGATSVAGRRPLWPVGGASRAARPARVGSQGAASRSRRGWCPLHVLLPSTSLRPREMVHAETITNILGGVPQRCGP